MKRLPKREFPVAICVQSDRADTCRGYDCPMDVRKCFPNYKIPEKVMNK